MRKLLGAILAFALTCGPAFADTTAINFGGVDYPIDNSAPATAKPAKTKAQDHSVTLTSPQQVALNRVQHLYGLQPPSSWFNQEQRWIRLGFGQFIYDALGGSTSQLYSNIAIIPSTGLYVYVQPAQTNGMGSVYQYGADDTTAFGGYPSGVGSSALPADPTTVYKQGLLMSASANIGPLSVGGSSGQSVNNLIECQVQTVDQTPQTVNIATNSTTVTSTTANRDRADNVVCQNKPGTSATTGSQTTPSADAGWTGVGYVTLAFGATTISGGNVTLYGGFGGFASIINNNIKVPGSFIAGSATAPVINGTTVQSGDLMASRSTTSGALLLGGSSTLSSIDWNVSNSNALSLGNIGGNTPVDVTGSLLAYNYGSSFPTMSAGEIGSAMSATTGEFVLGGGSAAQTCDFGITTSNAMTCTNQISIKSWIAAQRGSGSTSSYVPPTYTHTGGTTSAKTHIVYDAVTASSTTTTITLSGDATFTAAADYVCNIANSTAATASPAITYTSGTSFSFPSVNTDVYEYMCIGF